MAKKKEGKNITINQLAVMVNNGFESLKKEIRSELQSEIGSVRNEIGSVRNEIGDLREEMQHEIGGLREEMHQGFRMMNGAIDRSMRRTEYHDDEIFEIKGRLKVVEKKLDIKPSR